MTPQRPPHARIPRRLATLALVAALVALLPLSLLAAGPFGDLNGGSPHNGNIQAIADAGITKGCDPPDYVSYCPNDLVTREQMASFLARTAGLGGNPPVANALSAVTAQTAGSATTAQTAANATQLGGQPASFYQPAGQPVAYAANAGTAATVGTFAPNQLARVGRAQVATGQLLLPATFAPLATVQILAPAPGFVLLTSTVTITINTAPGGAILRLTEPPDEQVALKVAITSPDVRSAPASPTAVFPVAPGAHTFALEGVLSGGAASASNVTLTALFIPFGYDGGATLAPAP